MLQPGNCKRERLELECKDEIDGCLVINGGGDVTNTCQSCQLNPLSRLACSCSEQLSRLAPCTDPLV